MKSFNEQHYLPINLYIMKSRAESLTNLFILDKMIYVVYANVLFSEHVIIERHSSLQ